MTDVVNEHLYEIKDIFNSYFVKRKKIKKQIDDLNKEIDNKGNEIFYIDYQSHINSGHVNTIAQKNR